MPPPVRSTVTYKAAWSRLLPSSIPWYAMNSCEPSNTATKARAGSSSESCAPTTAKHTVAGPRRWAGDAEHAHEQRRQCGRDHPEHDRDHAEHGEAGRNRAVDPLEVVVRHRLGDVPDGRTLDTNVRQRGVSPGERERQRQRPYAICRQPKAVDHERRQRESDDDPENASDAVGDRVAHELRSSNRRTHSGHDTRLVRPCAATLGGR